METVLDVLRKTEAYFGRAGLENPRTEAQWLMAGILDCRRLDLFLQFERPLEAPELERLREAVRRRARGEPLQYIFGYQDFHDIRLQVGPGALIPRPETEQLVEKVIGRLKGMEAPRIVDLGTGTGAIALALARALPGAKILAVDRSPEALALARENAVRLELRDRVAFRSGDWLAGLDLEADCIVSNPPYLTEAEWASARPEVREHEPREALVASESGLSDLGHIVREAFARLSPGGLLALETGIEHGPSLSRIAGETGYVEMSVEADDSGRTRFFFARKPGVSGPGAG